MSFFGETVRHYEVSPVTDAKKAVSPPVSPPKNGETPSTPKTLLELVLDRHGRKTDEASEKEPRAELSHRSGLEPKLGRPSPPNMTLDQEAAAILAELHPGPEPLPPSHWLELAELARLEAVATFSPEKQHDALKSYLASCCEGKPAQLIAAHAVALLLWARRGRAVPIGHCHDAAARAVGLEPDSILWQIPIPKRGRR